MVQCKWVIRAPERAHRNPHKEAGVLSHRSLCWYLTLLLLFFIVLSKTCPWISMLNAKVLTQNTVINSEGIRAHLLWTRMMMVQEHGFRLLQIIYCSIEAVTWPLIVTEGRKLLNNEFTWCIHGRWALSGRWSSTVRLRCSCLKAFLGLTEGSDQLSCTFLQLMFTC